MERHRLQYLVMKALHDRKDFSRMSLLHFAPEPFFRDTFRRWFGRYTTADVDRVDVDHRVDLRALPFDDGTFDCLYASHVLEHIREDEQALYHIRRVLRPGGVAVLPVPIVSDTTIEYPQTYEFGHVRAPGPDYFEKYAKHFDRVETFSSADFGDNVHQIFIYEDRTVWPTKQRPLARPMPGPRHLDIVPVCHVGP
jgi:SAM-dependent methyltransferase